MLLTPIGKPLYNVSLSTVLFLGVISLITKNFLDQGSNVESFPKFSERLSVITEAIPERETFQKR